MSQFSGLGNYKRILEIKNFPDYPGNTMNLVRIEYMRRLHLTLFLDPMESMVIEYIRKRFNPEQFRLIPAHITLCRENELEDLTRIKHVLETLDFEEFDLSLGEIREISAELGVWVTLLDPQGKVPQLREMILGGASPSAGNFTPHITLMHPMNSKLNRQKVETIKEVELSGMIRISRISLIEQQEDQIWKTLEEYQLKKPMNFLKP